MKCTNCGRTEEEVRLVKFHFKGKEDFICVKCFPILIHGSEGCKDKGHD